MAKYSNNVNAAVNIAAELAMQNGGIIGSEHVLCGLCSVECIAANILARFNISKEIILRHFKFIPSPTVDLSPRVKACLEIANKIAVDTNKEYIGTEHVLLAILADTESVAVRILKAENIDIVGLSNMVTEAVFRKSQLGGSAERQNYDEPAVARRGKVIFGFARNGSNTSPDAENEESGTELDKFGVNLTQRAKDGKLDPVIGRDKEIERVIQILCRRTKNNPVLIGEPGVGKSAIAEGLAQKIVEDKVPEVLKNKIVFSLDMGSMVAGTKYRGDFEERFKNALETVKKSGNIILFIDEIHTLAKAGGAEGAVDAASMLKPMLARGEIQTLGATTIDEYRKFIEPDAALERRFQPIIVDQPSPEDTIVILKGLRDKYEAHHKVRITDEAIIAAANLSDRYITDRFLPDKAIDLIDEAASRKRIFAFSLPENVKELEEKIKNLEIDKQEAVDSDDFLKANEYKIQIDKLKKAFDEAKDNYDKQKNYSDLSIGEEEVAEIVASQTGIPLTRISESESDRLLKLENTLKKRVVGQENAVSAVARAIKRARAGLKDPKRPIGSFIFLGPTGVGKTELCKALAEAMFGDENLMIRVDMSEYMDKANVSKMIGSAPGYVGFDEGGQLTEKVRRKPYSVVLFDEIEKAHPDVFNILLQILEDGRLTDSHGRTINFKNTILIMTSNIGSSEIGKMPKLGFGASESEDDYEAMKEKQMEALKNAFRPEFINRVDDIVIFNSLNKDDMVKIADIMFASTCKKLKNMNMDIEITPSAKNLIIDKGYNPEYGARPLRRTIQKLIEDRLSEEILSGELEPKEKVIVDAKDGELTFGGFKNINPAE